MFVQERLRRTGGAIHWGPVRFLFLVLVSAAVFMVAVAKPFQNWDVIGYVASAYEQSGMQGDALARATYEDVEAFVSGAVYDELTTGPAYREPVAEDPSALEQQLPFYEIRVVYVALVRAVGALVGSMAQATVVVSALAAAGIVAFSGALFLRARSPVTFVAAPVLIALAGGLTLGRLSTPDSLAALGAVALFMALDRRRWALSIALIAILPLLRTDFILLAALCTALLVWTSGQRWHALAFVAALASYVAVNAHAGNYGHLVIFNFTLITGPQPYPADMAPSRNPADYIGAYVSGLWMLFAQREVWAILLAGVMLLLMPRAARGAWGGLYAVAALFVAAHFLLFPAAFGRTYFVAMWTAVVIALRAFDSALARNAA